MFPFLSVILFYRFPNLFTTVHMHCILYTILLLQQVLVQAILRRAEAAKQFKALGDGNVLAEFYWSTKTHGFYDCSPASRLGFETVLHVACRLDFKEPARSTGHRTRKATSQPTHLPLELWHYILSFLRRSDLDTDADARLTLEQAPLNDVNRSTNATIIGRTPLMVAAGTSAGRNDPDSAEYAIVKMLLDCPSLDKNVTVLSFSAGRVLQLSAVNRSADYDAANGQPLSLLTKLMIEDPDVDASESNAIYQAARRQHEQELKEEEMYQDMLIKEQEGRCGCENCRGGYYDSDAFSDEGW